MRVLVTGACGQLGKDVVKELESRNIHCRGVDIGDFDLTDEKAVGYYILGYFPSVIVHCAAYTKVDEAERNKDLCFRSNSLATDILANAAKNICAKLIYISTDYVFNGAGSIPFETYAPANPLNVYGLSKLMGEETVRIQTPRHFIVRTSFVFSEYGNNFLSTVLRLLKEGNEMKIVNDQIGSPTYTKDLAVLLADMCESEKYGTYHATNEGFCSFYEWAVEIAKQVKSNLKIIPVKSSEFISAAKRPLNSRLSKSSLVKAGFNPLPAWQDAVKRCLEGIVKI